MSFADTIAKLPVEEKVAAIKAELDRRKVLTPESYVALPMPVPVRSRVSPVPADFQVGWVIGMPGLVGGSAATPEEAEKLAVEEPLAKKGRIALQLGLPDEEVAEDYAWLLNKARAERQYEAKKAATTATYAQVDLAAQLGTG